MTRPRRSRPAEARRREGEGGPADFRRLYEGQLVFVGHRLRRLGVPICDLEDMVQDVFLVAYRRAASFDAARPVRPWLAGISARVALDHRRLARHRHEVGRGEVDALDERQADPESALQAKEARALVRAALAELPRDQRSVFELKELGGLSIPEIVAIVGAPPNTLYSRLRLARARFCAAVRRLSASALPAT